MMPQQHGFCNNENNNNMISEGLLAAVQAELRGKDRAIVGQVRLKGKLIINGSHGKAMLTATVLLFHIPPHKLASYQESSVRGAFLCRQMFQRQRGIGST